MKYLIIILSGVLFGAGLTLSGMTDPANVVAFLDILGDWNGRLAFVMGGGLMVTLPMFWWSRRKTHPIEGGKFEWPSSTKVDKDIVLGGVLFGIGWGLYGLCPGPAVASLWTGNLQLIAFLASMLLGFRVARYIKR